MAMPPIVLKTFICPRLHNILKETLNGHMNLFIIYTLRNTFITNVFWKLKKLYTTCIDT